MLRPKRTIKLILPDEFLELMVSPGISSAWPTVHATTAPPVCTASAPLSPRSRGRSGKGQRAKIGDPRERRVDVRHGFPVQTVLGASESENAEG